MPIYGDFKGTHSGYSMAIPLRLYDDNVLELFNGDAIELYNGDILGLFVGNFDGGFDGDLFRLMFGDFKDDNWASSIKMHSGSLKELCLGFLMETSMESCLA